MRFAPDGFRFFESVRQGFERASQAGGTSAYCLSLGGYIIELRFASPLLAAKIRLALEHLAAPRAVPALSICLWDSASTGIELPHQAAELVSAARANWVGILGPRGELVAYHHPGLRAAYALGPGILSLLDVGRNLAVYWVADAAQIPYYEASSPLKTILSWWMSEHERQFVHAGAVGTSKGGVLLAGRGGSGKSSTVLACLGSPLKFASDDYALIAADPEPFVYGVYNTAKLGGRRDLDRFPRLTRCVHNPERLGEEKLVLALQEHFADELSTGFPIKALMVPRVAGTVETTVRPMTPAAALTALAATTLFQLAGSGKAALHMMASVVRRVPRYELALGTDVTRIPQVLLDVLAER
jgi:hypothetical protein